MDLDSDHTRTDGARRAIEKKKGVFLEGEGGLKKKNEGAKLPIGDTRSYRRVGGGGGLAELKQDKGR